jgi:hypothetical protein
MKAKLIYDDHFKTTIIHRFRIDLGYFITLANKKLIVITPFVVMKKNEVLEGNQKTQSNNDRKKHKAFHISI